MKTLFTFPRLASPQMGAAAGKAVYIAEPGFKIDMSNIKVRRLKRSYNYEYRPN